MPKKDSYAKTSDHALQREIGGGSCARKNHIGMYRLQTTQLQHDKRKEIASRQNGNKEVL